MDKITKQWIILCSVLTIVLLIFMILWITCLNSQYITPNITYSAEYGLYPGTDGVAMNICGSNGDQPCSFTATTLAECLSQCSVLSSICKGFVYIRNSNLMKIIDVGLNQISKNNFADLYIKQTVNINFADLCIKQNINK
jgi:hypothetical protein